MNTQKLLAHGFTNQLTQRPHWYEFSFFSHGLSIYIRKDEYILWKSVTSNCKENKGMTYLGWSLVSAKHIAIAIIFNQRLWLEQMPNSYQGLSGIVHWDSRYSTVRISYRKQELLIYVGLNMTIQTSTQDY